jgi:hypothetical protein
MRQEAPAPAHACPSHAGIIIDSYARGRRKAVWVSTSTDLYADAVRDLRDLGAHIPVVANLQALDKATNTPTEGVLFATYSTLTSTVKGRSRAQQLADWLGGAAFDGVLVFDEASPRVCAVQLQCCAASACPCGRHLSC